MMRIDDIFAQIEAENPEILEIAHEVDPPSILAVNVIRTRNERGMTQAQLAEAVGVAQPRIAELERGDANPRLVTLSKIAHALGITLSELLDDTLFRKRPGAVPAEPVELSASSTPTISRRRAVG